MGKLFRALGMPEALWGELEPTAQSIPAIGVPMAGLRSLARHLM